MRYLDVCSGISAPTMAWKPLGWQALCFAEIEAAPRAVLAHHYPDVPLRGDFTEIRGDEYGPVDLLVGGTPCQSFSVAGLRGGLDDDRGNLALEFLRLADRARPRWLVWENVPGVLSSNGGRDFGAILGGMGELGYGFAYRVLDAQFFGVPQRRRRVFVVGHPGDWRCAAAVLLERHSLQGHSPPRRQAGEGTAVCPTLRAGGNRTGGDRPPGTDVDTADSLIAHSLRAQSQLAHRPDIDTLIAHSLRAEGFDASEDGTGRGTPLVPVAYQTSGNCGAWETGSVTGALDTNTDPNSHVVCFAENSRAELRLCGGDGQTSSQLTTGGGKPGQGQPCVAFQSSQSGFREVETHATLDANNGSRRHNGVAQGSAVRRLTPRECERLQGFPDDFTMVPFRGRMMADGPRYKMLGNSMAVPVVRWIGERIHAVDALLEAEAA